MKHDRGWGLRGAWLAAVAGSCVFSGVAAAQAPGETPGAALRRQLQELAASPTSVQELVETGRAALAVGDGEAALGFFTRASQLAPRDARVKAGLAAANVRTGRPETALFLFNEARSLGATEGELAGERGLAYDLLGQTARAQQDYTASLRHREDPEVRRRLALSLAISGQRDAALRLIDSQVRIGDRAAARTRVMVLALTGDVTGATAAANAMLPSQAARAITPVLPRLASLSPGQMASAANFGRVSGGYQQAGSRATATADPGALAFAGGGTSTSGTALAARLPVTPAPAGAGAVRRRPGVNGAAQPAQSRPVQTAERAPVRETARPQLGWTAASSTALPRPQAGAEANVVPLLQPHPFEPLRIPAEAKSAQAQPQAPTMTAAAAPAPAMVPTQVEEQPKPVALASIEQPAPLQPAALQQQPVQQPAPQAASVPAEQRPAAAPVDAAAANLAVWNNSAPAAQPSADTAATAATDATTATIATAERPAFADVVATVASLPVETAAAETAAPAPARSTTARREPTPTTRQATSARTNAATRAPAKPKETHPSRVWVQLAQSPNRSAFSYEIGRMRRAAPELMKDRQGHVAPAGGGSYRLLVGPFPNEAAARTFMNGLKKKDITSLSWTSPAGTEVERIAAGR